MSTKLELNWIGKDNKREVEPRILIENESLSYAGTKSKDVDKYEPDNMLIHGDNLLALKALEKDFTGSIKCIYIDPPFNTGQAFDHYDDNLEHSIWLDLMRSRFQLLYKLLEKDGLFWIHLDDNEVHYCKVLLDEIFSRQCFVSHITYERSAVAGLGQGGYLVDTTEHILLYRKGCLPSKVNLSYEELGLNIMKRYSKYVDNFGEKHLVDEFEAKSNGLPVKIFEHTGVEVKSISLKKPKEREKEIRAEFTKHIETLYRGNRVQKENEFQNGIIDKMDKDKFYSVEYIPSRGKNKDKMTTLYYSNKELLSWLCDTTSLTDGMITKSHKMTTLWKHGEIPKADIANEGDVYFPRSKKPEQLIKRIIEMSTDEGDWVLDSFLGSGTTATTAHKMNRRWIGIEMGDHAYSHCKPRIDRVINGQDTTGITKSVDWLGGGSYKFYELAPSLLEKDHFGELIISKEYDNVKLAASIALHEGFTYSPSEELFWKQSYGNENSYLFVSTRHIDCNYLDSIKATMLDKEYLIIACRSYDDGLDSSYKNIVMKKIPESLLNKCEFGIEDYNLNIVHPESYDGGE